MMAMRSKLMFLSPLFIAVIMLTATVISTAAAAERPTTEIAEVAQELHPDRVPHVDSVISQFSPSAVKQRIDMYHDWQTRPGTQSPVDAVRAAAGSLGLDARSDSFYLVSESPSIAVVRVTHMKKAYTVTLVPASGGAWIVAAKN
ncbi:MAG: hypothetical protein P4N59_28465 [Negativicutes bacterium]|nr:hypothetical protein [Negativicutes bacterium]